jgi:carbonic anhydrase/acetyltransferase-like protein (isoleucine patch superfamily)
MYRRLSKQEIESLEARGCTAQNWSGVEVKDPFNTERLKNVTFSDSVKLGTNKGETDFGDGLLKPSGIYNCFVQNCTIGDNAFLSNIGTLANYNIGENTAIENVGTLRVKGKTTFGNGHEIDILNEGGGRELPIFDRLSAQIAYLLVIYRHNPELICELKKIIFAYVRGCESEVGKIGNHTKILHTKTIENVNIGDFALIRGASLLEEGTIKSNEPAPVFIGENVNASHFIVLTGSKIDSGVILTSTFVGQGVKMGKQYSAENSAFFANCEAFHGEACSIFAGPYTVTHHKSTLLIAGLFSFYNAGSGTNQSNHMYKLGPIHQGIAERGSKTGSFSYMLWPCRVGAFSVVMDKHPGNFDTSEFPFSYISLENGKSILTPAMNLFTVGTARDSKKWPSRDRRTDPEKFDLIHFDLLNPYTAGKILAGTKLLAQLNENTPKTREFASYKGIQINRLMLRTSKRYYELALNVYLTGELVKRLQNSAFENLKDIRRILAPENQSPENKWIDMAGMLAEKTDVEKLNVKIVSGKVRDVADLHYELKIIADSYAKNAWGWCAAVLKSWKKLDVGNLSKNELIQLLADWKTNITKFNNMILKDAEKEFDQHSRIGYGPDGEEEVIQKDFENIRGKYASNKFVAELKEENEIAEKIYSELTGRISKIQI